VAQFTFNPNDLHRLNRLVFLSRGAALEEAGGAHRTRKAGEGTDFLDFREYTPGDDFRKVDWLLYGRLRQLFVRLHEAPRQLSVTLLVDTSRSMAFGTPITKLHQAQRIACALGFVALRGGDRVFGFGFADSVKGRVGPLAGPRALPHLVSFLNRCEGGGTSDLLAAVNTLRARRRCRGLVIILSDFLNVPRCEEAISAVLAAGGRACCVQVLDALDRGIGLTGNVRLRDSETGALVDVKIDDGVRAEYGRRFEEARLGFEQFCLRRRQQYLLATTRDNYLELVSEAMRARALVR
jgi:uncharacterized protein (DUF58 family)